MTRSHLPAALRALLVPCLPALAALAATTADADRLTAGGTTLEGTVKSVSPAGVAFQPAFAATAMTVAWDKVEDLATDGPWQVLYGDDQSVTAPLDGFRDGRLLVGDRDVDPGSLVSVAAASGEDGEPAFADRLRSQWRYWHGGLDVAFNLQQATTDNLGFLVAFHSLRSKGPTRLHFGLDYRYVTERNPDNAPPKKKRTGDSASGLVRGEYDLTERIYLYASADALYDAVQNLSLRAVPKAGAGYVVWQRKPAAGVRDFLQLEAGAGWVYEKYSDNGDPPGPFLGHDDYATVSLGAAAGLLLPRGMTLAWRFDWLPSVTDPTGDYVVRTSAGLTVPLVAPLAAKISISDTYDSTPSGGAEENTLIIDTGLSLTW